MARKGIQYKPFRIQDQRSDSDDDQDPSQPLSSRPLAETNPRDHGGRQQEDAGGQFQNPFAIPGEMRSRNLLRKNPRSRPKIFFYGKDTPHYAFTNFSPHPVEYEGKEYPTTEHLFQSFKASGVLGSARANLLNRMAPSPL